MRPYLESEIVTIDSTALASQADDLVPQLLHHVLWDVAVQGRDQKRHLNPEILILNNDTGTLRGIWNEVGDTVCLRTRLMDVALRGNGTPRAEPVVPFIVRLRQKTATARHPPCGHGSISPKPRLRLSTRVKPVVPGGGEWDAESFGHTVIT